jgi:hypothetical protein
MRELSDDEDEEHTASQESASGDPSKPWLREFYRYLNTDHHVGSLSIVEWWGVSLIEISLIFSLYLLLPR